MKDLEGDDVTSADDGCHQARVLISTRDRAEDVARCVASILANDHVGFDVLVVDQSQDESTVSALRDHATDSRLQIVRSATVGLGRSRNVSLLMDGPDLCLVLDDDCIAPAGWVADMVGVMEANPEAGMVFGRVVAAEHDPALGFVPETGYERDEIVRSPRDFRPVGLGAAVGLRRSRVLDIGGFDPMLGPGARFRAFDDQDIALRLLLAGIPVVYSRSPAVVHHGFRTYEQGRSLIRGYTLGGSAAYGKYLKCGRPIGLWFITRQITRDVLGDGLRAVRLRQKPPVLGRLRSIISGTVQGIMAPVDRSTLTFVDPQESDPELYA